MPEYTSGAFTPSIQTDTLTSIYGAAQSTELWNEVIDRCAVEAGAVGGAFLTHENAPSPSYFINAIGEAIRIKAQQHPALLEEYFSDIAPLEILAQTHMQQAPARKIWVQAESWPETAFIEAKKHADWFRNHLNVGHMLAANLNDNPRIHETFVLHYQRDQNISPDAHAAFALLLPHLAKSAEMSVVYNALQQRYAAMLTVLNKVGVGMCVLDKNNNVLVKNTEAERMLAAGHGIQLADNHLTCSNSDNQAQFSNAISAAQLHLKSTRAESLMAIRSSAVDDPLLIEISPLRDVLDELDFGYDGVLVQMVDTGSRSHCSVDAFANAYKLTEAEKSVTQYLIDGFSNNQIAEERGTKSETVKTQVAHIMQKSKSQSRVELVRRVLKTLPPIDYS